MCQASLRQACDKVKFAKTLGTEVKNRTLGQDQGGRDETRSLLFLKSLLSTRTSTDETDTRAFSQLETMILHTQLPLRHSPVLQVSKCSGAPGPMYEVN